MKIHQKRIHHKYFRKKLNVWSTKRTHLTKISPTRSTSLLICLLCPALKIDGVQWRRILTLTPNVGLRALQLTVVGQQQQRDTLLLSLSTYRPTPLPHNVYSLSVQRGICSQAQLPSRLGVIKLFFFSNFSYSPWIWFLMDYCENTIIWINEKSTRVNKYLKFLTKFNKCLG